MPLKVSFCKMLVHWAKAVSFLTVFLQISVIYFSNIKLLSIRIPSILSELLSHILLLLRS